MAAVFRQVGDGAPVRNVGTDDFPEVPAATVAVDGWVDARLNEPHRAVAYQDIKTGGVWALKVVGVEAEVGRGPAVGVGAGQGLDRGRLGVRALARGVGVEPAGPPVDRARPGDLGERAPPLAACTAGRRRAMRTAMNAMTNSSSFSVKARRSFIRRLPVSKVTRRPPSLVPDDEPVFHAYYDFEDRNNSSVLRYYCW